MTKEEYYSLPHMRAMRRMIRRRARVWFHSLTPHYGVTCTLKLHDRSGANCLKSKRYKGRYRAYAKIRKFTTNAVSE